MAVHELRGAVGGDLNDLIAPRRCHHAPDAIIDTAAWNGVGEGQQARVQVRAGDLVFVRRGDGLERDLVRLARFASVPDATRR